MFLPYRDLSFKLIYECTQHDVNCSNCPSFGKVEQKGRQEAILLYNTIYNKAVDTLTLKAEQGQKCAYLDSV